MRKLALSNPQRSEPPVSPRHHNTADRNSEPLPQTAINTPLVSMITLRESNIRSEPSQTHIHTQSSQQKDCSNFQSCNFRNSPSFNTTAFLPRDRDCVSPFSNGNNANSVIPQLSSQFSNLSSNIRESNTMINSNNILPNSLLNNQTAYSNLSHRIPSSRLLSSSIDQRILKQSTEDCRRLLQQVILLNNFFFKFHLLNYFSLLIGNCYSGSNYK